MPPAPIKDVLVVGFGAVGAIYSYTLKRGGLVRVTAVARSNYDIVNSEGLTFHSQRYGEITNWKPDRLVNSVADAADRSYSYVFVTTKAVLEVTKTSDILRPLLSVPYADRHPQPTFVLVQNGLNVEHDLYHALLKFANGPPSIVSTALYIRTNLLAPNVVEHDKLDRLDLGFYRHKDYTTVTHSPEEAKLLQDLGSVLKTGGTTVTIVPEIQRAKFKKNLWNLAFSSVSALTGYRIPALWRPPSSDPSVTYEPYVFPATANLIEEYTLPSIKATLDEFVALGRAVGFPDSEDGLPSSCSEETLQRAKDIYMNPLSTHTPSILLDVQKGLPIEVEAIFGEVVRLARECNVPVPRIETLYGQLLVIQNQILRRMESNRTQ